MDYKILMRKWSKLVSSAQRNRSKGVKSARATGGVPSTAPHHHRHHHHHRPTTDQPTA